MRRLLTRLAAAALVAAAALAAPVPQAQAAACDSDRGVTVVVDYGSLGGGIGQSCVPGGGGDAAATLFQDAGYGLTYVRTQPGFVCRVAGAPASESCQNTPPGGRFWGLWWSSGNGSWTFASAGVQDLTIPDGGSVAFAWDDVEGQRRPGVGPAVHDEPSTSSTPSPTRQPTTAPTRKPTPKPTRGPASPSLSSGATASADAIPSASASESPSGAPSATSPTAKPSKRGRASETHATKSTSPTATPSGSPSASDGPVLSPSADQPAEDDQGVPAWLALVALLVVAVATGAVLVHRRRSNPGP